MGLQGKLDRARDGAFFHANINVDVIVSEEPPLGQNDKPPQVCVWVNVWGVWCSADLRSTPDLRNHGALLPGSAAAASVWQRQDHSQR